MLYRDHSYYTVDFGPLGQHWDCEIDTFSCIMFDGYGNDMKPGKSHFKKLQVVIGSKIRDLPSLLLHQ